MLDALKPTGATSDIVIAMRKPASIVVEVFAILFVAGLVAAIAIPDFDSEQPEVQLKAVITSLETARTALDRYWGDHAATYPTLDEINELSTTTGAFRIRTGFAAYLDAIPDNPFTKGNRVGLITDPVGSSDWIYDPVTGVFKANDSQAHRAL